MASIGDNGQGIWDNSNSSAQRMKNPGGKQNALSQVGSNSTSVQDQGNATNNSTITSRYLSDGQPVGGSGSPDQSLISTISQSDLSKGQPDR